ncbi:MAG TPA: hypothetical protein VKH44_01435, partial [Pirellulaceae bacterium]|nr:hypothetical protein [Pirellulaceae bacterium]
MVADANPPPAALVENDAEALPLDLQDVAADGEGRLLRLRSGSGLVIAPLAFVAILLLPLASLKPSAHRLA